MYSQEKRQSNRRTEAYFILKAEKNEIEKGRISNKR
jgi:hypothetical protein